MKINYEFKPMKIETDAKIVKISASHRGVFVLTGILIHSIHLEDNKIHMVNARLKTHENNIESGVGICDGELMFGGKVIDIGGNYRNKYVLV